MDGAASPLEQFRAAVVDLPTITLVHDGKEYDVSAISDVLYMEIDQESACDHCGDEIMISQFVVESDANDAIFLIDYSVGCWAIGPQLEVDSFRSLRELKVHLRSDDKWGYTRILATLFPPHPSTYLGQFRSLLDENRKFILTHQGQRYKARTITDVLYFSADKQDACPCGYGCTQMYVVTATEPRSVIFLVRYWDGCMSYEPSFTVHSFDRMRELQQHLITESHNAILDKLFPVGRSPSSDGESSESTDSY